MNAVFAAVLLAVVATVSGTSVVSTIGGSNLVYAAQPAYQYVSPSSAVQYQYVQQPYVASSAAVVQNTVPVTYANTYANTVVPSAYSTSLLNYPYASYYGAYGLLKK